MPYPTYVVIRSYDIFRIAQRDEKGVYRTACQMEGPFNNYEAALALCDQMNTIDAPLQQTPAGDRTSK